MPVIEQTEVSPIGQEPAVEQVEVPVVALETNNQPSLFDWTTDGDPQGNQFSQQVNLLDVSPDNRVLPTEPDSTTH